MINELLNAADASLVRDWRRWLSAALIVAAIVVMAWGNVV